MPAKPALLLGAIADDFTGATDLANNLVRQGMRTVQTIGVPGLHGSQLPAGTQAAVVALKTRTLPAADAIAQSLQALQWLQAQGAQQIYFKICSTFDSTAAGNIGPVTEALMDALGANFAVATPAFPDNSRTVYKGHLFVGDLLLSDSGMRDHPLTPMTDANLVRVLQAQSRRRVGLIDHRTVRGGALAIAERIAALVAQGVGLAVVDAIDNDDLLRLGPALVGMPLITAGSGVAIALPANFGLAPSAAVSALPPASGFKAVIAGSCSQATRRQVQHFIANRHPTLAIEPLQAAADTHLANHALRWAAQCLADNPSSPLLIYATAEPAAVAAAQAQLGVQAAGEAVERVLATVATGLLALGVRQWLVAGGETSGACVQALGITQLSIGPQIDPGVPWCHAPAPTQAHADAPAGLHLALKSGNFGSDDFFTRAFDVLAQSTYPTHQQT
jgi:uncharacterized protein YgbK (DUF1537 family)